MPLTQDELVSEIGTITLYDGRLTVEYRIGEDATNQENAYIMDMQSPGFAERGMLALCSVMARLLVSWDLLDNVTREPISIDEQTLYTGVKSSVLLKIFEEIQAAKNLVAPTKYSANGSVGKHHPTFRGGQSTSRPRGTQAGH